MKILVKDNIALYSVPDNTYVGLADDKITIGDPVEFYIGDCNSSDTTVYTGVTDTPADWIGHKYLYDGTTWTANPNYVAPDAE